MKRRAQRAVGSLPRLSRPLSPVLAAAREEAEQARHGYVGVEHLLVALAREEAGPTARLLTGHGVTHTRARDAMRLVVGSGRGDGPQWDAGTLLATLGIDLDEIRRHVEERFGPNAIMQLYTGPVGWNLRPRGPLCPPQLSPQLKRAIDKALGRCWDSGPPQLYEHLLLGALDADSPGLGRVLGEMGVSIPLLRAAVFAQLQIAS